MSTIETPRLVLRPLCAEDLADFYEYAKNPKVGPDAGWKPHESLEETRGYLEEFYKLEDVWAIAAHENGKMTVSYTHLDVYKRQHPVGKTLKAHPVACGGHGEIQVGRVIFRVDLFADCLC